MTTRSRVTAARLAMSVFDKLAPRAQGARSIPRRTWSAGGAAAACLLAAIAAKRAGATEVAVGVWVVLAVPAVFAWLVHASARDGHVGSLRRVGITTVTYLASGAIALGSIVPGARLGEGTLASVGDDLSIFDPAGGTARIAVSGELPSNRPGYVGYELHAGGEKILGAVQRTTTRIRIERAVAHRHGEQVAELYTVTLPQGRSNIVLAQLGGELAQGLRVSVFDPPLPPWTLRAFAILAFVAVALLSWTGSEAASVTTAAGIAIGFGMLMSAMATPHRALEPSVRALALAVPTGVLASVVVMAVARRTGRAHDRTGGKPSRGPGDRVPISERKPSGTRTHRGDRLP